jgi:hypothetical protein
MTYSIPLATPATKSKLRTPNNYAPFSGMCSVCVEGCVGSCEIGNSALRGGEAVYPISNDKTQSASEKDYPVDFSHFNINGSTFGAQGCVADSNCALFPNIKLDTEVGIGQKKIKLKAPIIFSAVAKLNWADYYSGAALAGVIATIGEDACAKDPDLEVKAGRVVKSPLIHKMIRAFKDYEHGYGAIFLQANVDDEKLGVLDYAIGELGLETVELKMGQGAKGIQGLGVITSLDKALAVQKTGYAVAPDPSDPVVQESYHQGFVTEFLKVGRLPMWDEEHLHNRIEELRSKGAKYVSLKVGPYRPADLARIAKFACQSKLDYVTFDGAGGGTGKSPWKMMNEWGLPTVYLESLLYEFYGRLKQQGLSSPKVAIAGGFALEDQIFKGLALGAPHISLVGMCRAPMAAAMVGKTVGNMLKEGRLPTELAQYGTSIEELFANSGKLKEIYGDGFTQLEPGAIGVFNYVERIKTGLQQLMALGRKFSLASIDRDDIFALTKEAANVSGIKQVTEIDREEIELILG